MLRADHPEIKFLCKGAKLNVHPSRMSSQMSSGLVAYELKLGKPSEEEDIVRIFDYEDKNITSNIEEQRTFYKNWVESLIIKMQKKPEDNTQ
jgi:tRNA-binding EMAP/Myf-like protein